MRPVRRYYLRIIVSGKSFAESRAPGSATPSSQQGELQGFVRLGYFYPEAGLSVEQMPFLAMVALPVFLLAPFFYFLLRTEVRPIKAVRQGCHTKTLDDEMDLFFRPP